MAVQSGGLETRRLFSERIRKCNDNISMLHQAFQQAPGVDNDKKSIYEQSFRDVMRDVIIQEGKDGMVKSCSSLIHLAINSAEAQICYHSVPFLLLSDALDCITLDYCEELFDVIENKVSTWTKPEYFSSGKILLLRMCNDLLRRLSYSQNTVFCGRIQLFLAQLFPLSEKSALNLMSHFNLENATTYKARKIHESREVEEGEEMEVDNNASNETLVYQRPIDYNLYQKLWSLQDYFCLPTQCFHQEKWKQFVLNVQEVLQAFSSYKLESISTKRRKKISKDIEEKMEVSQNTFSSSHFFAKYLTSDTLVNLQLSDSHFRRHIFIQLLILFQYLTSDIKFKTSSQNMSESQQQWVESTTQRVYELLEETPPDGKGFAEYIRIVLEREVTWINWKNQGCPSFEKNGNRPFSSNETDKRLGETIYQRKEEKDLGNKELSRLWNLCPDNLESCSSPERIFVPAMDIFLDEALEQTKPDCQVPKEDKIISNPNYRWQALRLLSRESTHFFPYANQSQIRPLDDYLENVIIQTCKEL